MPEKIKGTDALIRLNINGSLEVYCYATSINVDHQVEFNGVSTEGDGSWKKYRPKRQGWTVSFDALALIADDGDKATTFQMLQQMGSFVETLMVIVFTGETGSVQTLSGNVFFNTMNLNWTAPSFVAKSVNLLGNGAYTLNESGADITVNISVQVAEPDFAGQITSVKLYSNSTDFIELLTAPVDPDEPASVSVEPGEYYVEITVVTADINNTLTIDAPPTASVGVSTIGTVVLDTAPFGADNVLFDFNENRNIILIVE